MRSLSWKLAGALVLMVGLSVGLMAYFSNLTTAREFSTYISQNNQRYEQNTAAALARLYAEDGNWNNVNLVLDGLLRTTSERLVVADTSSRIVGDTENKWVGQTVSQVGLTGGIPINVSGREVGELFAFLTQTGGHGKGYMGGGMGNTPALSTGEQDFLNQTNRYLLITAIVAGVLALAVGLLLTRLITRPIRALTHGAHQIAKGDLKHRVNVKSRDELGELGQSFNVMAASLEEAEDERKRIIADIAHELRTPLTIIDGTIDGIQDGVFKADKERLGVIKEQTALLTRLASDLRDLSLAESGQLKLVKTLTDMVDLVRRKALQFQAPAVEKGITIEIDLPRDRQETNIDPARIEQSLGNLISNAIRHTPRGGKVTVSLRQIKAGETSNVSAPGLLISVADTGEGIPPEHLPHIFERFYRVESSRARTEGGAGLGLAIVKRMVEAHGGKVWAESQQGKGSTFYFTIPRQN